MPVWLTLFGSVFATVGFFVSVFALIVLIIEGRRTKAKPKLGLAPGSTPGTISVWVDWDPEMFALQIYRLRISHVSPENKIKEGTFTVTWDNPQTQPFVQPIEFPESFKNMLERDAKERSLLSFEFRTVDEMSLSLNCHLRKAKKIYRGLKGKVPKIANVLAPLSQDIATVFSLDFAELQDRKKRMKDLEAAAKAKAAKAAPAKPAAPAPAPSAAATPAPSSSPGTPPPAVASPTPEATKPLAEDVKAAPAKSVRDVVSATNKSQTEKVGDK